MKILKRAIIAPKLVIFVPPRIVPMLLYLVYLEPGGNLMEWFIGPFRRFADFSGRSGHGEFWPFAAANTAIIYALATLDHAIYGRSTYAISAAYFLLVLIPLFSLTLRRLRDAGRSEYLIFLLVAGVPGLAILLFLMAGESVPVKPDATEPESVDMNITKTLAALFCYSVSLYWLYCLGLEFAHCGSPSWIQTALIAIPFLYLLTRLYTKRNLPWPAGSGAVLTLYISGILVIAMVYPYFSGLLRKSTAAATISNLTKMRDILQKNASSNTPADITAVIPSPPELKLPSAGHSPSSEIRVATFTDIQDSGHWFYDGKNIYIDCTHKDPKEIVWSAY